jgi:hypothetical protein
MCRNIASSVGDQPVGWTIPVGEVEVDERGERLHDSGGSDDPVVAAFRARLASPTCPTPVSSSAPPLMKAL